MPDGNAFEGRHVARRVIAAWLDTFSISSINLAVKDIGYEARTDALNGCGECWATRQDRTGLGLDGHDLEAGQARLQRLAHTGDGAAGADARHEEIELAGCCRERSPRPWSGHGRADWPGSGTAAA